jgi:hypothetical protein
MVAVEDQFERPTSRGLGSDHVAARLRQGGPVDGDPTR